ncbi:hypothetical protein I552_3462 [Mycobacterium xenopi 3993]|nr:hypothetical protein I552_3462 [Mycobacterium xenopi 3993]
MGHVGAGQRPHQLDLAAQPVDAGLVGAGAGIRNTMRWPPRSSRYNVFCDPPPSGSRTGSSPSPGAPCSSSQRPRRPASNRGSLTGTATGTPHSRGRE